MRAPNADFIFRGRRAAGVGTSGVAFDGLAASEPSYVQSVLFGRKRARSERPLAFSSSDGASASPLGRMFDALRARAGALLPRTERHEDNLRQAPEWERN